MRWLEIEEILLHISNIHTGIFRTFQYMKEKQANKELYVQPCVKSSLWVAVHVYHRVMWSDVWSRSSGLDLSVSA